MRKMADAVVDYSELAQRAVTVLPTFENATALNETCLQITRIEGTPTTPTTAVSSCCTRRRKLEMRSSSFVEMRCTSAGGYLDSLDDVADEIQGIVMSTSNATRGPSAIPSRSCCSSP